VSVQVNNAGIFIERYENRSEWTEEDFNATLSTNFKGGMLNDNKLTRHCVTCKLHERVQSETQGGPD